MHGVINADTFVGKLYAKKKRLTTPMRKWDDSNEVYFYEKYGLVKMRTN
jgi:hypothetical protein